MFCSPATLSLQDYAAKLLLGSNPYPHKSQTSITRNILLIVASTGYNIHGFNENLYINLSVHLAVSSHFLAVVGIWC